MASLFAPEGGVGGLMQGDRVDDQGSIAIIQDHAVTWFHTVDYRRSFLAMADKPFGMAYKAPEPGQPLPR
jgi:hypothetical protein